MPMFSGIRLLQNSYSLAAQKIEPTFHQNNTAVQLNEAEKPSGRRKDG